LQVQNFEFPLLVSESLIVRLQSVLNSPAAGLRNLASVAPATIIDPAPFPRLSSPTQSLRLTNQRPPASDLLFLLDSVAFLSLNYLAFSKVH